MPSNDKTAFERLLEQISALPLWIKHVIYLQLRNDLEKALTKITLDNLGDSEALQLLIPQLTPLGRTEAEIPSGRYSTSLVQLLKRSSEHRNVVNICIVNGWTLENCSVQLVDAVDQQLIVPPTSVYTQATLLYLGNRIRIGDYLVKIGRLTLEQLDQALRTQKYIEESLGEKTGIANVLINLGYIHKRDSEAILFLKEESKKAFDPTQFQELMR